MLNILKIKKKQVKKRFYQKKIYKDNIRYFPASTQEWFDSIYNFNKSNLKLLPFAKDYLIKLLNSYFNLYNVKKEARLRFRRMRNKKRRLMARKFFLSRPEIKHTSDIVHITIYVYNRQYSYLINKIRQRKPKWLLYLKFLKRKRYILKRLSWILKKTSSLSFNLNEIALKYNNIVSQQSKVFFFKKYTKRFLKKEKLFLRFKRMVAFNKSRFKITYLYRLTNLIEKIYKKKVEFNVVTLKNYYLNSDILSQLVVNKIIKRKNRGKALKMMRWSINKVKVLNCSKFLQYGYKSPQKLIKQNLMVKNSPVFLEKNSIDYNVKKVILNNYDNNSNIQQLVLKSTKQFMVNGIRIEAFGRLTKRIKASRAVYKQTQIGTLQNIKSSQKRNSSLILKGNKATNIQYTTISSKTRIGAFGIKGWVSAY